MTDTERLDWLAAARATVYKSSMSSHWTVVDERPATRTGHVGNTLRDAIDNAMAKTVMPGGNAP